MLLQYASEILYMILCSAINIRQQMSNIASMTIDHYQGQCWYNRLDNILDQASK